MRWLWAPGLTLLAVSALAGFAVAWTSQRDAKLLQGAASKISDSDFDNFTNYYYRLGLS